jgi:hypothetical protein
MAINVGVSMAKPVAAQYQRGVAKAGSGSSNENGAWRHGGGGWRISRGGWRGGIINISIISVISQSMAIM